MGALAVKPLTDFLSRLSPLVPGCPQPMALQALRDTAIDFCTRTHVVRAVGDPVTLRPGVAQYDLDLPGGMDAIRVLNAWYGSTRLELAPAQQVTAVGAYTASVSGAPVAAYVLEPATIHLFPTPDAQATEPLVVQFATRPTRQASEVDDVLFDEWVEVIVAGALARLAVVPGTSFSNADMAVLGAGQYAAGVSAAKLEARKGHVRGDVRVRGLTFSGVRR